MEVKINKEIRDYQESMFFGLSLRQCIFSLLAVGTAVGIYFGLQDVVGGMDVGWICILGAAPFAACGFVRYHGLTAEQFVVVWFRSEFLMPEQLVCIPENTYANAILPALAAEQSDNIKVCPYGIITTNRKSPVYQGFSVIWQGFSSFSKPKNQAAK